MEYAVVPSFWNWARDPVDIRVGGDIFRLVILWQKSKEPQPRVKEYPYVMEEVMLPAGYTLATDEQARLVADSRHPSVINRTVVGAAGQRMVTEKGFDALKCFAVNETGVREFLVGVCQPNFAADLWVVKKEVA